MHPYSLLLSPSVFKNIFKYSCLHFISFILPTTCNSTLIIISNYVHFLCVFLSSFKQTKKMNMCDEKMTAVFLDSCEYSNFLKLTEKICKEFIHSTMSLYNDNEGSSNAAQQQNNHRVTNHIINCCKTPTMKRVFLEKTVGEDEDWFPKLVGADQDIETLFTLDDGAKFSTVLHRLFDAMFFEVSDDGLLLLKEKEKLLVNWGRIIIMFQCSAIAMNKIVLSMKNSSSSSSSSSKEKNIIQLAVENCVRCLQDYFRNNSDLSYWIEKTKGGWNSIITDLKTKSSTTLTENWSCSKST